MATTTITPDFSSGIEFKFMPFSGVPPALKAKIDALYQAEEKRVQSVNGVLFDGVANTVANISYRHDGGIVVSLYEHTYRYVLYLLSGSAQNKTIRQALGMPTSVVCHVISSDDQLIVGVRGKANSCGHGYLSGVGGVLDFPAKLGVTLSGLMDLCRREIFEELGVDATDIESIVPETVVHATNVIKENVETVGFNFSVRLGVSAEQVLSRFAMTEKLEHDTIYAVPLAKIHARGAKALPKGPVAPGILDWVRAYTKVPVKA